MQAFFIEAEDRRLFAILHGDPSAGPAVLIAPALFEEMNRCRQTVNRFARQAAAAGVATLILDLHGTGESEGEFGDSGWETWLQDLEAGLDWLLARGASAPTLLGIRGGCLLAAELLARRRDDFSQALFWQPVPAGRAVITEMLRMRIAASLSVESSGPSVTELRAQLTAGENLESGGYLLTPALVGPLESAALAALRGPLPPVAWLEISASMAPLRPVAEKIVERWRADKVSVDVHQLTDPPFWSTAETTIGEACIANSLVHLELGHAS